MPFNGSGVYNPIGSPDFPAVAATTIRAAQYNNEINDLASALTNCVTRDGQSPATADLPMGGMKHTNVAAAALRTQYARAAEVQDGTLTYLTSVAGVDTITATAPLTLAAYSAGQNFRFVAAGANTGAVTLNINSLGAKAVVKNGATVLTAGDIPAGSIAEVTYDGTRFQLQAPAKGFATAADIQSQTYTAFTTGGTGTAFTLTPTPAITAYAANQEWDVVFSAACGAAPTFQVSGLATPPNLVKQNADGSYSNLAAGDFPSGWSSKVKMVSTTQALVRSLPAGSSKQLQPISASVAANALTLTINPTTLDFRSTTLTTGVPNTRTIASAISMTVSSGSTLGTISGVAARIAILALDNAGTVEVACVNLAGGNNLDETTLISTTAEGGAGAADSKNVIYSATARTNVPFRVVGFIDITEATAGTWATAPSTVQGAGGQAMAALQSLGYGQTWQDVKASRVSGTTYYNTTGRPIAVSVTSGLGVTGSMSLTVDGLTLQNFYAANAGSAHLFGIVPPGSAYIVTSTNAFVVFGELR